MLIFLRRTSVDSGYGGSERNRALEPQSQPANEQRRQRRERSRGNFLKIQYKHSWHSIAFLFLDNDEYQRELRLVKFKLDEERALNSKLEEKIRLHNVKVHIHIFFSQSTKKNYAAENVSNQ